MVGLTTRVLGARPTVPAVVAWLERLRPTGIVVSHDVVDPSALGEALRERGVLGLAWVERLAPPTVEASVPSAHEGTAMRRVGERAGRAHISRVVLEGTPHGDPAADERTRHVENCLRAAHALRGSGLSVLVRNQPPPGPLGFEQIEWILEDARSVTLALDVAAMEASARAGEGPSAIGWLDRFAGRTRLLFAAGLGSDGGFDAHPEEGSIDWPWLAEVAPRDVPWVFDPSTSLAEGDVADGLRMLHAARL